MADIDGHEIYNNGDESKCKQGLNGDDKEKEEEIGEAWGTGFGCGGDGVLTPV